MAILFAGDWILNGEEIIVESVDIQAPVSTSKDWVEAIQKYKHHISVKDCNVRIDSLGNAFVTPSVKFN